MMAHNTSLTLAVLIGGCALDAFGVDPAREIDRVMQARFEAKDFNGVVLVARDGHVIYERGLGFANMEWRIPNDSRTKFELGSITKQFTATLVLQFVNEGKIRLDGHLYDYLPYYRKDTGGHVTIHHLLSHVSGIPNFTAAPGFLEGADSRRKYTVQEFVLQHCSGDLEFEPGTKFAYSNSGYFLLGAVLEQLSGETYESLLQQRIFTPLNMTDSGYTHSETVLPHRAAGYERSADGLRNARYYDMSIPFSAGALYSTARDLYLWDQALYTERLLPGRLRDLLFAPNLENYGYGWGILKPAEGAPYSGESIPMHGGAIFGFQSLIQRIPAHRELIVLLDNTDSQKLLDIALEIRRVLSITHSGTKTLRSPSERTVPGRPSASRVSRSANSAGSAGVFAMNRTPLSARRPTTMPSSGPVLE
jgi:CubicO group peptidase (beta-lactamase class C family)